MAHGPEPTAAFRPKVTHVTGRPGGTAQNSRHLRALSWGLHSPLHPLPHLSNGGLVPEDKRPWGGALHALWEGWGTPPPAEHGLLISPKSRTGRGEAVRPEPLPTRDKTTSSGSPGPGDGDAAAYGSPRGHPSLHWWGNQGTVRVDVSEVEERGGDGPEVPPTPCGRLAPAEKVGVRETPTGLQRALPHRRGEGAQALRRAGCQAEGVLRVGLEVVHHKRCGWVECPAHLGTGAEGQGHRDTERQRYREMERQRQRHTEKCRKRQTEMERQRHRETETERRRVMETDGEIRNGMWEKLAINRGKRQGKREMQAGPARPEGSPEEGEPPTQVPLCHARLPGTGARI